MVWFDSGSPLERLIPCFAAQSREPVLERDPLLMRVEEEMHLGCLVDFSVHIREGDIDMLWVFRGLAEQGRAAFAAEASRPML